MQLLVICEINHSKYYKFTSARATLQNRQRKIAESLLNSIYLISTPAMYSKKKLTYHFIVSSRLMVHHLGGITQSKGLHCVYT